MRTLGTLIKWNEERGFGFVKTHDSGIEVFAHISEFPRGGRRPQTGDALMFEIATRKDGRKQARHITFDTPLANVGLTPMSARHTPKARATRTTASQYPRPHRHTHRSGSGRARRRLAAMALLLGLGLLGYRQYQDNNANTSFVVAAPVSTNNGTVRSNVPVAVTPAFRCDGRQHCSQMHTCAEATWFIRHCPNTKMDGDHDGIPCEQQLCN